LRPGRARQNPRVTFDLIAGRNVTGTPVIHVVGDSQYTHRIIDCETDCWLSSPVDLLDLVQSAASFLRVRLATARDGRPLVVVSGEFSSGPDNMYYLDLSQGSVNYYYANGQAIAQRITSILEHETHLYYLHHDLFGNLTEVTDESDALVGRARYDALGGVLTSTIPLTLTSRLPGGAHLDADAGLVYDGAGRFYDAALGLYLQPDPFGAAPEAPESLNRYAAPGVSTFPTVGSVPNGGRSYQDFTIKAGLTAANKMFGYLAESQWTPALLSSMRLSHFGKKTAHDFFVRLRLSWPGTTKSGTVGKIIGDKHVDTMFQRVILGELYIDADTGRLVNIKQILDPTVEEIPLQRFGAGRAAKWFRKGFLDNALPFGVDFLWQFGTDLGTDMPFNYRVGRATVAGLAGLGAGFAAGGLAIGTAELLAMAGIVTLGGPAIGLLGLGIGIFIGVTIEKTVVDRINEAKFPVR
jgi:hypothetical protein